MNWKRIDEFIRKTNTRKCRLVDLGKTLKGQALGKFSESLPRSAARSWADLVDYVTRGQEDFGIICAEAVEEAVRELAFARAGFKNGPGRGRARFKNQLSKQLREIPGKRCGKQRTAFRRRAVIAGSALSRLTRPAIIPFAFVVKRGLHPVAKTDRAFALNSRAQTCRQR